MAKKNDDIVQQELADLTADLQRVQADFVNYRRRVDEERAQITQSAKAATIMKLLPLVDNIERAVGHLPEELSNNAWAKGVASLAKNLDKSLQELGVTRIIAEPGTQFDPTLHEAVTMEEGNGEHEIISEELRAGYKLADRVIRPAMVKVKPGNLEAGIEEEPIVQEIVQTELEESASTPPHKEDKGQ